MVADLVLGSASISIQDLFTTDLGRDILLNFRIPKAVVALVCGVALAVCGLQMQTLFRNPLADPYILGVSSGAGLGVALYIMGTSLMGSGGGSVLNSLGSAGAALAGAALVTVLIMYVSNRVKGSLTLLIFAVMIGFIASALVNLLQYTSNAHSLKAYVLWTMGSFAALDWLKIGILCVLVLVGLVLAVMNIKDLNAILPGDNYASSMGLDVKKIRMRILVSTTLLSGAVTAFCGPIGFLGIDKVLIFQHRGDNLMGILQIRALFSDKILGKNLWKHAGNQYQNDQKKPNIDTEKFSPDG